MKAVRRFSGGWGEVSEEWVVRFVVCTYTDTDVFFNSIPLRSF